MAFVDYKCPSCGREIRVDASRETCYCNACGRKIETSITKHKHADKTVSGKGTENVIDLQPRKQPATEAPSATTAKPGIGKVIGCVILCDLVMSFFMGIISMGVFREMGYSAYLGPSLLTLVFSILLGASYRATGKMSLPIFIAVIVGIVAGLLLPYVGLSVMRQ